MSSSHYHRIVIFFSWTMLTTLSSAAQERFFEFIPGWEAKGISEDSQGNYRTLGNVSESFGRYHVIINELAYDGVLLQSWEFDDDSLKNIGPTVWNSSFREGDSSTYLTSTMQGESGIFYGLLARLDSQYNLENISILDSCCFGNSGMTLMRLSDNNLLATGYHLTEESYNYTSLSKYNSSLERLWTRHFYCDDDTVTCTLQPYATTELSDGGILLTCLADYYPFNDLANTILIRADPQGNELCRSRPGDTAHYWIEPGMPVLLDNGNFLFFWSDTYVIDPWLDDPNQNNNVHFGEFHSETGVMIWEDDLIGTLPTSNSDPIRPHQYTVKQAQRLEDGNILISGYDYAEGLLIKMTPSGQVLWWRTHRPEGSAEQLETASVNTWLYEVLPTSDGGLIGVGEFRADPGGATWPQGFQSAFALKLDSYGCLEPGCQLLDGVQEYSVDQFQLWPNPSQGILNVNLAPGMHVQEVMVVDVLGKVIQGLEFKIQGLNHEHFESGTLNLESLPSGLYSLILTTKDGQVLSATFVME